MLSHDSSRPLYSQVEDELRKKILSGEYPPHSKLPSEMELCAQFSVSRITIRRAIVNLEASEMIYTVHGKGTFVKSNRINSDLKKIRPFGETLAQEGHQGYTRINSYRDYQLTDFDKIMGFTDWKAATEISLTGYSMDEPVVLYKSVIRAPYGAMMKEKMFEMEKNRIPFSTFDLYPETGLVLARVDQRVLAINADAELSGVLNLKQGDAVLVLDSSLVDIDNRLVERKKGYYRTDKYSFKIYREV